MPSYIKVGAAYKTIAPYVKVGGAWTLAKEAWTKVSGSWKQFYLAKGANDSTFNIADTVTGAGATGFNSLVRAVVVQPDGKILVGGDFTSFNGTTVNRLARLNSDGTLDSTFTTNIGTGFNNKVRTIALQSDGKILVGGDFTSFQVSITANRIIRLNANGTNDSLTWFTSNGFDLGVNSIAVQSDGKIVVGGLFNRFRSVFIYRIVRLESDGSRDTAFNSNTVNGPSNEILSLVVQSDQKIVLVGKFTAFNGTSSSYIARLNSDGTLDSTFTTNIGTGANNWTYAVALQSDGKIVLGGWFTTFNGATVNRIVRLNSDGTRDTAFTDNTASGPNSLINCIVIQPDAGILVGGQFETFNGVASKGLVRLNSNGTIDTVFNSNSGNDFEFTTSAEQIGAVAIALQSDSKIIVGGSYTAFNSKVRNKIARVGYDFSY